MSEQKKNTNKELLFSKDEKQVLATIESLRDKGTDTDLALLADLYSKTNSDEIQKSIYHFFRDLRNQNSVDAVVRIIKTTGDHEVLKMILSSTWESRLNYIGYFELFIDLVINQSFEIAFEAFTLIESFEEKTTEARKETLINYVKNNIGSCSAENIAFASDLEGIIQNYRVEGDEQIEGD